MVATKDMSNEEFFAEMRRRGQISEGEAKRLMAPEQNPVREGRVTLTPEELGPAVRKELNRLTADGSEYSELKAVFNPARFKAEVRELVKHQLIAMRKDITEELSKVLKQDFYKLVSPTIQEEVLARFQQVSVSKEIKEYLDNTLAESFVPIVEQAINLVRRDFNNKVAKTLHNVVSLKTSTIMEIQEATVYAPTTEGEALKLIEKENPENFLPYKRFVQGKKVT
jgi:hypothetical protein